MNIKDQIRAEIERRKGYISVTHFAEELLAFLDTIPEQPVKNPCSFYSEGYGCEISPMKNCIGCEHNRWGLGTKVAKKQPVTTITKSNALFDKCVENCDPAVMKEVSDNIDKMLGRQPASEGLEEAAEEYRRESCNAALKPNVDGPTPEYVGSIKAAFIAGAKWQKDKMMEGAVEGKVFMSFAPGHNQMVMADVDLPTNTKVKVIIVKEDEK